MNNEERQERAERIERTIAFIIEQQAQAEVRATKIDERWRRTEEGIRGLLSIAEIHERGIHELRDAGQATDERLNALINAVEKQITERRNGKNEE